MTRKAIGKKVRFEVFKRDGFQCHYCGASPPKAILHVDHIHPVARGGTNSTDNLITSCSVCNIGKGATPLSVAPESISDKAKRIQEQEDQLKGYLEVIAAKAEREEDHAWDVATIFVDAFNDDGIRKDWFRSIKRFNEQIGVHECMEAMAIATERFPRSKGNCFRYFCGICWRKIRGDGDGES